MIGLLSVLYFINEQYVVFIVKNNTIISGAQPFKVAKLTL